MTESLIITIGSYCIAIAAIGGVLAGSYWIIRKIVHISDTVQQLLPNGGSSVADKINKLTVQVESINVRVQQIEKNTK